MLKRIIGLTGGIGTGKTTVSNYLADTYQLPILDADIYARDAVQPGSPVLNRIITRYGSDVQLADGTLNRKRLGEIVFPNPKERQWLEQQIHPYVRDRIESQLNTSESPTVVVVIPLLFEANMTDLVTEIWVVSCPQDQQIQRIQERDRLSVEQAQSRLDSQLPLAEKVARADVVLDNSSTHDSLLQQVDRALMRTRTNN
ncbi:dephospho-CoA kinase [Coleofasciculus sp. B1-GNL1-01]|uniref:dephospho-CoA kinase n=1 Tax=Coleofasciculus sp. B1-GNL1-01 TaxID=3068484 RepID=UPI0040636EFF